MTRLIDVTPGEATEILARDGVLVDVREEYETAEESIAGALSRPLSRLASGQPLDLPEGRVPVFFCASGARTSRNSSGLAGLAGGSGYGLVGGIHAWRQAGLPTDGG